MHSERPRSCNQFWRRSTSPASLHIVEGGDHSFKVTSNVKRQAEVFLDVQRAIVTWIRGVTAEHP